MDPIYFQSDYRQACEECMDCFHQPCKIVAYLNRVIDDGILLDFMAKDHQWLVMTQINYQIVLGKPMIVQCIFSKAWNTSGRYAKQRFPGTNMLGT